MKYLAPLLLVLASCSTLDTMVPVTNPETGEVTEMRLGDIAAEAVDQHAGTAASIAQSVIPNPVVGAGFGAALLAAAGAASSAMRKKKQPKPEEEA